MYRWANRKDAAQAQIVSALREAGVRVWIIETPCDLLTFFRGRWLPLEVKTLTKTGKRRKRKDQPEQDAFIAETGTPVVGTPEQALHAASGEYICPGCHLRQQSGVKTEGGF